MISYSQSHPELYQMGAFIHLTPWKLEASGLGFAAQSFTSLLRTLGINAM
jgi:hypothetical protein